MYQHKVTKTNARIVWRANQHSTRADVSACLFGLSLICCCCLTAHFGQNGSFACCAAALASTGNPLAIFNLIDNSDSLVHGVCRLASASAAQFSCLITITMAETVATLAAHRKTKQNESNNANNAISRISGCH